MAAAPASTRCRFAPRHRSSGTSAPASSRSRSPGSTKRAVVPAGSRPLDASLRAGRHPEHCRIDHRPLRRPGGRTACSRTQARHARSSSSHAAPGRRSAPPRSIMAPSSIRRSPTRFSTIPALRERCVHAREIVRRRRERHAAGVRARRNRTVRRTCVLRLRRQVQRPRWREAHHAGRVAGSHARCR